MSPRIDAWCSWCKAVRPMHDIQGLAAQEVGKTALQGHCSVCGESMFTIGNTDAVDSLHVDERAIQPPMIGFA